MTQYINTAATSIRIKRCDESSSDTKPSPSEGGGNIIQSKLTELDFAKLIEKLGLKQVVSSMQPAKSS